MLADPDFVVAILGPPNAGKSTLFNRLQCKERNKSYKLGSSSKRVNGRISSKANSRGNAIVSPIANTTRDRRQCWGRIGSTEFQLIDTAGVDGDRIHLLGKSQSKEPILEKSMMMQTLAAAEQSDLNLLVFDGKVGVSHDLVATARWLRKLGKDSQVVIVANKLEGDSWAYEGSDVMQTLDEVTRLGFGEAITISALQGDGMVDLAVLIEQMKTNKKVRDVKSGVLSIPDGGAPASVPDKPIQLAILGRQNVGKSTLVNKLVKSERVLFGPTPGLTRDAIAVDYDWDGKKVQLVDTAGIRKFTRRAEDSIEDMAVADALRAMKVAEVAVLVVDAKELFLHRQELAICNAILNEGRALVIVANKVDLLEMSSDYGPKDFAKQVRLQLETAIPMLRNTPVLPMSCHTGEGVSALFPAVLDAKRRWSKPISTGLLNRWLKEVSNGSPLPVVGGVKSKLRYICMKKARPPTAIIFTNVDHLPDSYLRYLTRHLQESFELYGMAIRIIVKKSATNNPYVKKKGNRSGFGLGGRDARNRRRIAEYQKKSKKRRVD
ncbi:unnamed protein product [Cylindrotheca closterium]|uniref:GTPase Der n=1 Tax=Cylindrotheca closterium TaxID=2856 RepID=A0AAD2G2B1_9STRA|nr:unnamed protein product [Cylindrotheca closterium]